MQHYYWNDWYLGWGWFLWLGIVILFFSAVGNWSYAYRAHRRFEGGYDSSDPWDILDKRYARGEIQHKEYRNIKSSIADSERAKEQSRNQSKTSAIRATN